MLDVAEPEWQRGAGMITVHIQKITDFPQQEQNLVVEAMLLRAQWSGHLMLATKNPMSRRWPSRILVPS